MGVFKLPVKIPVKFIQGVKIASKTTTKKKAQKSYIKDGEFIPSDPLKKLNPLSKLQEGSGIKLGKFRGGNVENFQIIEESMNKISNLFYRNIVLFLLIILIIVVIIYYRIIKK